MTEGTGRNTGTMGGPGRLSMASKHRREKERATLLSLSFGGHFPLPGQDVSSMSGPQALQALSLLEAVSVSHRGSRGGEFSARLSAGPSIAFPATRIARLWTTPRTCSA